MNGAIKLDDSSVKKKKKEKRKDKAEDHPSPVYPQPEAPRTALLLSIASFLDANGFSKTLAAFLSEAQIEKVATEEKFSNLEEIFRGYLDLSKTSCNETCTLPLFKKLDDKSTDVSEKGNKSGIANSTSELSTVELNDDTVLKKKEQKKHKKKSTRDVLIDIKPSLQTADFGSENQQIEVGEESKCKKKKKTKQTSDPDAKSGQTSSEQLCEFVEEKLKDLKSLIQSDCVGSAKSKTKKKKRHTSDASLMDADCVGSEKAQEASKTDADTHVLEQAEKHSLGHNLDVAIASDAKDTKKKKNKLTTGTADQLHEGSVNENQMGKVQVVGDIIDCEKSKKSKRKRSAVEGESHVDDFCAGQTSEQDKPKGDSLVSFGQDNPVKKKQKTEAVEVDNKSENTADKERVYNNTESNGTNAKNTSDTPASGKINKVQEKKSTEPKSVRSFQRVKIDEVKFIDERLKDNSYWAKDGADVGYGAKAQEVLGQVKGRDFRHKKTQKKRGSYRGGQIDFQSHSIKFNYSDEE